jgi:hypothetical protein
METVTMGTSHVLPFLNYVVNVQILHVYATMSTPG